MANQATRERGRTIPSSVFAGILYLIMFAIYAANAPSALTLSGITDLLNNTVVLALAAAGLTFVILTAELDLSSVGVIAVTNVVVATVSTSIAGGAFVSLILVSLIGTLVGVINGGLVAYLGLQSLACTLGTMIICQGIALLILAAPGGEVASFIMNRLTDTVFGVLPVSAVILLVVIALWLLCRRTHFGIAIYAVGTDATASRLSGINVRRTKLIAFGLAGLAYALAGYMLSAQTGTGDPRVSNAFLLYVFAAVAIGGTSLMGGRGGLIGSVVGAGILTVMQKMLFAMGIAEFYTNIFNGIIMVLAILFGSLSRMVSRRQSLATRKPAAGGYAAN
ncbi:MAG: ribose transport system permease protein [Verrucomicrobiota bacterium]|jgi:ribose transport system permease protein|nr:ribose transport system permease protein [Verrucomicrobiota bacterium]